MSVGAGADDVEAPASRFREELQARRLIPTLATALVVGILEVVISMAQLVRRGPSGIWVVTRSVMGQPVEQVVPPSEAETHGVPEGLPPGTDRW